MFVVTRTTIIITIVNYIFVCLLPPFFFHWNFVSLSLPQKDKETKNLRRICNKLLTSSNRIKSKKKSAKSRKKLVENFQRGSKVRHSKTNLFYDVSAINPEDRSNATAGLFQMKKVGKKKIGSFPKIFKRKLWKDTAGLSYARLTNETE